MSLAEFELLIERHEKDIFSFCCYLTMDRKLAEELYQETVLHAFISRGKLESTGNPVSYLLSIAVGKWRNTRHKASRRQRIAPEVSLESDQSDAIQMPDAEDPAEMLIRNEDRLKIEAAVSSLDEMFRLPVLLYYFSDYSIAEVGEILHIPPGTVKSRLYKARSILAERLRREGITG
ncbi:MAG: RNA polymerase sigma factor [Symbiobacteriaceae bacterium]|nr:RNA polymerase sigma factor [Symbiobacteriaceae bacterium]